MRKVTPYVSVFIYMALLCIFSFHAEAKEKLNRSNQGTQDEILFSEIPTVWQET